MNVKNTKALSLVRYDSLDKLPPAPPLSNAFRSMSDAEVECRALADPGARVLPADFWDKAQIVEPEVTEQITLHLPRRAVGRFKSTGKGNQSRINAVLASYVDATGKRKVG
jgi:uncharacterized protein (DUF4415 family)